MSEFSSSAMVEIMARMQAQHNQEVHPQWEDQGYEYYRAIWVECAELLDHYGWKWWKKQAPDLDQVKLEIVDIWHFGLSDLIRADKLNDDVTRKLAQSRAGDGDPERFRQAVEALARSTVVSQSFDADSFVDVMAALPMDLDELFSLYLGKNVLNNFRQKNGYRSGEYTKVWSGREDNEHLVELLETLTEVEPELLIDQLYGALETRYRSSIGR
jgi:dimeric dUTPase (all-alpha-NTP-PPase superfamily)